MPGLEGTMLGHYRLQRRLGRGGMAEVYLASDEHAQHDVAIKLVSSSHAEYSTRFQHEIEIMSALAHSHILPVLDSGEHGPWRYLVMPYMQQGTLRQRLVTGPLSLQEAARVFEQVANTLQFAHDRGIIHRDIKPSNILLHDEHYVYLADFGLARAIEGDPGFTQTDTLMGTPEYMAPELLEEPATISSDIYALGILLYEMLTGHVPFKGSTPIGICWKHLHEQPVRPSLLNPTIPQTVERVILCALEKDPHSRFKSARAMAQAYQEALASARLPEMVYTLALTDTHPVLEIPGQTSNDIAFLQHMRQYRLSSVHKLLIALTVCIFLLTTSLSLGFFVASNSVRTQLPIALGAVVHGNELAPKRIPPTTPPKPFPMPFHLETSPIHHFIMKHHPRALKQGHGDNNAINGNDGGDDNGERHPHASKQSYEDDISGNCGGDDNADGYGYSNGDEQGWFRYGYGHWEEFDGGNGD